MENPVFLSLSLCFLILFNACLATDNYIRQDRYREDTQFRYRHCQFDHLDALEPTHRIEAEGGVIESWDPNHKQFGCAKVAVFRYIIDPNGLLLPQYSNAPRLMFIEKGRGFKGVVLPGCPETYQESQQSSQGFQDRHQKIRQIRADDIFAVPAGAVHWAYNDGNEKLVIVVLQDVGSHTNQLDLFPRTFYLAGNPEEEFEQSSQEWGREGQTDSRGRKEGSSNKNNIFTGFTDKIIAEILNINLETARKLRAEDDYRRNIIKIEGFLEVIRPPGSRAGRQDRERDWDIEEEEERVREIERKRESRQGRGGQGEWTTNGLEETFCSMRLRENIGDASRADIYVPGAGRISTANSHHFPVLRWFQLSAERGRLYRNGMYTPHWNQNAHSVIYAIRGRARVQVVDDRGQNVFDGELRQHQLLVVPQNFVLVKKAGDEGFDWIAFKTNDDAMISPLAGKTSVIRALPAQVIAASFRITNKEALTLKRSREELTLFPGIRSTAWREDAVKAM